MQPQGGLMRTELREQPVPRRALAISVTSLALPVAAALWLPDIADTAFGTLTWLTALIPAFLLAYYRGLSGVAVALAGGMAVITATQIAIVTFDISEPNWPLLAAIVGAYMVISLGIGAMAELLRRERKAAEAVALLDGLTGLPNRRYADMVLEQEFAAAARGGSLAVVIYDLDRFKSVNDRFGHATGDTVLQAFAHLLKENTRRANISARFGGEEFISILRDTDASEAVTFTQRVLDQTRALEFHWGRQTASAGIAQYEHGMGSYELLVSAADRALYQAKEGGRDRCLVATTTAALAAPIDAPVVATVPAPGGAPAAEPATTGAPVGAAHPLVYIVDDDAAVLAVIARMLRGTNADIRTTTDPEDVIRAFDTPREQQPALVVTDIIMPKMTGPRMIEQIVKVHPGVAVIYMSGYMHGTVSTERLPGAVTAVIAKPVALKQMRDAVATALSSAAQGPT